MPALEKGSSLKSTCDAVRSVLGESGWQQVLGQLDPETRAIAEAPERHHLVPSAVTGRLCSAVHHVAGLGDRSRTEQILRLAGRHDADLMLDGVFSVFARFVSPQLAFKRAGSIIGSVYSGVTNEVIEDASGKGGTLVLQGLGDAPFYCCVLSGWMERAMQRFGAAEPSVRERAWEAGLDASDRLEFVLRWE